MKNTTSAEIISQRLHTIREKIEQKTKKNFQCKHIGIDITKNRITQQRNSFPNKSYISGKIIKNSINAENMRSKIGGAFLHKCQQVHKLFSKIAF